MRYLSVCSGIEAATVAWHPLGWTPAGFAEIEPFPRAVLEQRHGAVAVDWDYRCPLAGEAAGRKGRTSPPQNFVPLFGDFTKIGPEHVGPVDLLVGGTPCQSFSIAGKRLGLDDPRGNLAIEFLALAKRIGARWLVWENVPGVYSSWSGEPDNAAIAEWDETADFAEFLNLFRECGYRGAWRTVDAQYVRVDGFAGAVPQRRRRCFLVGHSGNDARAVPVLFDPESLRGLAAPRRTTGQGTAGSSGGDIGGNSRVRCAPIASTLNASFGSKQGLENQHVDQGCPLFIAEAVPFDTTQITSASNFSNPQPGDPCHPLAAGAHPPHVAYAIQERAVSENPAAGPQGKGWQEDIAFTLEARRGGQGIAFAFQSRIARNGRGQPEEICPTLNGADAGATSDMRPMAAIPAIDGWTVRKLTPRECERLQGFPDDFTAIQWRGKSAPDGPRYKAIGNSMAVNVMRWIGARIALIEQAVEEAAGQGRI